MTMASVSEFLAAVKQDEVLRKRLKTAQSEQSCIDLAKTKWLLLHRRRITGYTGQNVRRGGGRNIQSEYRTSIAHRSALIRAGGAFIVF